MISFYCPWYQKNLLNLWKHKTHLWWFDCDWFYSMFSHAKWYSFAFNIAFTPLKNLRSWLTSSPLLSAYSWIYLWSLWFHFSKRFLLWVAGSCFRAVKTIHPFPQRFILTVDIFLLLIPCWKPEIKATCEPPILWSGWTPG